MKLKAVTKNEKKGDSLTLNYMIDPNRDMDEQVQNAKWDMYKALFSPGINHVEGIFSLLGVDGYKESIKLSR